MNDISLLSVLKTPANPPTHPPTHPPTQPLTVGFSPMLPPRKILTPSTALPSSLAGAPISPMSPTCARAGWSGGWGVGVSCELRDAES
jgi:hypothetical protein